MNRIPMAESIGIGWRLESESGGGMNRNRVAACAGIRTCKKTIRTIASVNREISCLHHIMAKAREWDLTEQNPFDKGKSLLMKENNQRTRYLTHEEIQRLLEASPEHLRDIITCALNTAMRAGEIFSLKWDQICNGFIYLKKTKTNEPRQIPINDDLANLFDKIRKQRPGIGYVFSYVTPKESPERVRLIVNNEKPLTNVKRSFARAVKATGISDFRFHDLRHTAASHLVMAGASLKDVQEILGHKTMTMTLRYAHLSQEHKKKAINLLNGLTAPSDNYVTNCHKSPERTKKEAAMNG